MPIYSIAYGYSYMLEKQPRDYATKKQATVDGIWILLTYLLLIQVRNYCYGTLIFGEWK